ncbi:hypothetical protein [Thiobacillus denitrificans]|uniref:Uncharacterized protein n=1 Tax=Thiobacillus denitrificans TaxID=36861 RepID=A0A106BIY5_THIDE|nr:hypothetical protein [Thiobacillus denitrificans]KVW93338.1 hypothetical protein ABW22_14495 [Thiobacillus denitrificans]
MTSADLQHDLNLTIAHVVGQGVVAISAGFEIHLAVNCHPGGQSFDGSCWVRNPAGDLPESLRRSVAVAGCLSSLAFNRGAPEEIEPVEAFGKLQSGELALSETDAAMAEGLTLSDVAFALDVLNGRWAIVVDEVERMSPHILNNTIQTH